MATYVYDKNLGQMVEKNTREPMVNRDEWEPTVPRVTFDIQGYQSPITGEWLGSKRDERRHMEEHGAVHAAELRKPKKLKNERFIKKHGLEHLSDG